MSDTETSYAEDLIVAAVEAQLRAAATDAGDRVFSDMDRALDPSESPAVCVTYEDMVPTYSEGDQGLGTRIVTEEHVLEVHAVVIPRPAELKRRSKARAAQVRFAMSAPDIAERLPLIDLRLHRRTKFRATEAETLVHGGYVHLYVLNVRTREDDPDTLI